MFVPLKVNIGINDLKTKIANIKQKVTAQKASRVILQVQARHSQADATSALLLNIAKMVEADLYPQSKPSIFKVTGDEDPDLEQVSSLDDLDSVPKELSKQELLEDEENLLTDPKIVFRQTFIPTRKVQMEPEFAQSTIGPLQLPEEEIIALVRQKIVQNDSNTVKNKKDPFLERIMVPLGPTVDDAYSEEGVSPATSERSKHFSPAYKAFIRNQLFNRPTENKYRGKKKTLTEDIEVEPHFADKKSKQKFNWLERKEAQKIYEEKLSVLPMVTDQEENFVERENYLKARVSKQQRFIKEKIDELLARESAD